MVLNRTSPGLNLLRFLRPLVEAGLELTPHVFLAGGAIRRAITGDPIHEGDLDIYVMRTEDEERWHWHPSILGGREGWELKNHSSNPDIDLDTENWNFKYLEKELLVQFHYWHGCHKMEDVLSRYDFTCCQFAYDGVWVYYPGEALNDTKNHRLVLNELKYPGQSQNTIIRSYRFMQMGFKPTKACWSSLITLAQNLHNTPLRVRKGRS